MGTAKAVRINPPELLFENPNETAESLPRKRAFPMKQAVLYLRVSTIDKTTANQERELQAIASRMGWEIVKVYKDHGISGAKGREKRPAFDAMCRDASKRKFDIVMAWSVDRLARPEPSGLGWLDVRTAPPAN
jgi:hypothetical protein